MAHIRFVPALLVMFVIAFMTRGAHAQEASRAATALTPNAYTVGTAKADALLVVHYHRADGICGAGLKAARVASMRLMDAMRSVVTRLCRCYAHR